MKKVWAEIIAGVIPHKQTRNRWRGILRYGPINALRLKKEIKNNNETPEHYLSVVVIAKNEGPYFKEWLDWHIALGVEKFYVYDNESSDDTKEILKPYIDKGIVDYTYFPGYRRQLAAYDDCLKKHRYNTRWLAVIDMDEFIVPKDNKSIPEYLKGMEEFPVVEINWLCYGSSGQKEKTPGRVMDRFKKHSFSFHPLNKHVKSIFDPRRVYGMTGCHEVARINGKAADSNGERVKISWRDRLPVHDKIRINHYAVRSYEEFVEKKGRGRASGPVRQLDDEYFRQYDLNDLEEGDPEVVVSLTSFPGAIQYAVTTIKSLLAGSVLPDKIVLYLVLSDFKETGLPEELLRLQKDNPMLEIRDCPIEYRSYLKLIPALQDFPRSIIVTVDDDVMYPEKMLEKLLDTHRKEPDAVIAHRAKKIKLGKPYKTWKRFKPRHFRLKKIHKSPLTMQTGVGGVLYPPNSLKKEMLKPELFTRLAPTADDLWFWAAAIANGRYVVPVPFGYYRTNDLPKPKEMALKTVNFKESEDRNLLALKNILDNFPEVRSKLGII